MTSARLSPVRRTLAGLLFGLAYACISLTIAGFLLQRTAFDPGHSSSLAHAVLADPQIRKEIVDTIADATASQLGVDKGTLRQTITVVADHPEGAALFEQIIHDAHAHLIGEQTAPVTITGAELVPIVRNQAAADLPAVTLPVPRVGALSFIRTVLAWLLPITGIATLVFVGLGFAAHPERTALLKSLALGLFLIAICVALLGFVVPRFVVPALSDSPWARVPARVADDSLPLLVGTVLVLVGAGLALLASTGMMRKRQRWSTPVSTYRYNEERRWS
jgi:hypothetical protein